MTAFPSWALFGIAGAIISSCTMLLQENLKVNGYALAFWNKIGTLTVLTFFVLYHGFPAHPGFYAFTFTSASLYAVSDIVFFSTIPVVGAGTISRVLPASVIFGFFFWLAIDHASLVKYLAAPKVSAAIILTLCLWVYFATHLRKCAVSMRAARMAWFVIFAAIVGPSLCKKALLLADTNGIYAFVFFQALFMVLIWSFFYYLRKPLTSKTMFSRLSWQGGTGIGILSGFAVILSVMAVYYVDNPAYATAVGFLNSIMILGYYGLRGRKNDGNVMAGVGMVACAAALIILETYV